MHRSHQSLVGLFVLAGEAILDLFSLRVGLHIIDIVAAQPLERIIVGGLMRALPGNTVVPVTTSAAAEASEAGSRAGGQ